MASNANFTDECFVVHAFNKGDIKNGVTRFFPVHEGDDPDEVLEQANKTGGWFRKKKEGENSHLNFGVVITYHAFQMHWDGEVMADSSLLTG